MHGADSKANLDKLVTAAGNWRAVAAGWAPGWQLTQVQVITTDGDTLTLAWDAEANDWRITT